MAITAETRNSIIELVVTAYDAPPGTALLTELVAIVDGGGTLADVATALTTSDTWNDLYPSFLTAEEFATEWLSALVPEADADALAGGVEIAVGLINGGSSAADIIMVAQNFLATLAEDDAEFGTSAANFNNKVEVATYHTVTLELDADDISDLQNVLADVTSDDDSVSDAQSSAAASVPGENVVLTTGLDTGAAFTTGSSNDTFSAVSSSSAESDTLTTGDSLDGGDGTDTLSVAVSGSVAASNSFSSTDVENLKIFNNSSAAYTLDADLMSGLTDVFINGGTSAVTVDTTAIVNMHLVNTTQDATLAASATAVAGSADEAIILASGANNGTTGSLTATYNGLETINLVSTGATNEVTLSATDLETLNISGESDVTVVTDFQGVDTDAKTATLDASAAGGDVDATVTPGVGLTSITMGAGDDTIAFTGAITDEVTISGGEGTDTLSLTAAALAFDAESEDDPDGVNVSGIEALKLTGGSVDGRALSGNAESSITSATVIAGATLTHMPISSITSAGLGGTITLGDAEGEAGAGGEVTALTLTQYGTTANMTDTLVADEVETLTVYTSGLTSATTNSLTMSAEGSASLTSVVAAGGNGLTLSIAGDALESVNAAAVTGTTPFSLTASGDGDKEITVSSVRPAAAETTTANTVVSGEGADTIMGGAYIDDITAGGGDNVVDGGAGDDTIVGGDDDDDLTGGSGDDNLTGGKGDDTIAGGKGDDTIIAGRGDDDVSGGEGDDTIFAGSGSDTVDAGAGEDVISIEDVDSEDVVDGGTGVDLMVGEAAGISTTAYYQSNTIFVDTSGEDAELNLPNVEVLWLDWNNTDSEGSDLDAAGAESLVTLYLDINNGAVALNDTMRMDDLSASTLNLRTIDSVVNDPDLDIRFDGQNATVNVINDSEGYLGETSFTNDGGSLTLNLSTTDAGDEDGAEFANTDVEDLTVNDVTSLALNLAARSDTENAAGQNVGVFGAELDMGDVTVTGDALESITIDIGARNEFVDIGNLSFHSEGEIDDGASIDIIIGDDAEVEMGDIGSSTATAYSDETDVDITIGDTADLDVADFYLGAESTLTVEVGAGSTFDGGEVASDTAVAVDIAFGGAVTLGAIGDGGTASLAVTGRGLFNDPNNAANPIAVDLSDSDDAVVDFTGFNNADGVNNEVIQVAGNDGEMTIKTGDDFQAEYTITGTAGEDRGITIIGENASSITAAESDDTITLGGANDTIDGLNGDDEINGGAGDDNITGGEGADTIDGGAGDDTIVIASGDSDETEMDVIVSPDVEAATGESDTIEMFSGTNGGGTYTAGMIIGTGTAIDVSGADAEGGTPTITASVTGGIMTFAGADAGNMDTLAEVIDAAQLVLADAANDQDAAGEAGDANEVVIGVFFDAEDDGEEELYLVSATDDAAGGATAPTNDDVIMVTGVASDVTLGTAAAADTLVVG